MPVTVVNMIPKSLSGETQQDSEPNIAVNPENPLQIVATAFTPDPLNGPRAPIFVSSDGGATWSLRTIVPGGPATADISVGFGDRGGALYAGTLNFTTVNLNVLRTANPFAVTPMTLLVDRADEDQPWVTAATAGAGAGRDRVYVGHNNFNTSPKTATVEVSRDARTAPAPAGFAAQALERRTNVGQDGPPIRTAVHHDGTVYAAFHRWVKTCRPARSTSRSTWSSCATTTGAAAPRRSATWSTRATTSRAGESPRTGSSASPRAPARWARSGSAATSPSPWTRGTPTGVFVAWATASAAPRAPTGRSTCAARPTAGRRGATTVARSRTRRTPRSP